ncbi:MAG: YigZ family protein [Lachnospiraceae bacterium]|nr:YigZ family protein [Lachnospiraceae bacterium]MDD7024036.1 YigZ family protein [Oscillospiraceae bacterium]MDY5649405.1 YigZ family protein [Lachnospiraceae bacterium]
MDENYRIVFTGGSGEIVEKKSRFIATVSPVESEEEALAFIERTKKQYWDARHNCFAYVIGDHQELMRFSDDGEPQGTAGKPMLDVLLGEELHNTAVVVTRYFGGTLLGTGGLVRAYSGAVQEGLRSCVLAEKRKGLWLSIGTDYSGIGKVQYLLGQRGIRILSSEYTEQVVLTVLVPLEQKRELLDALTEGTNGKARLTPGDECRYVDAQGELFLL